MASSSILSAIVVFFLFLRIVDGNFEDARCRCVCPSTKYFSSGNHTLDDERRYYTKSNVNGLICNPQTVVKPNVLKIVDTAHLDAFLANCDCKHESRNTILLKVVVIFVICVVFVLITYMLFLVCLDPVLRKQRHTVPYRQQNDEMEDNIFARTVSTEPFADTSPSFTMRSRNIADNVLGRVEAEKNRWMRKVEEQRRNIFTDHTMLN